MQIYVWFRRRPSFRTALSHETGISVDHSQPIDDALDTYTTSRTRVYQPYRADRSSFLCRAFSSLRHGDTTRRPSSTTPPVPSCTESAVAASPTPLPNCCCPSVSWTFSRRTAIAMCSYQSACRLAAGRPLRRPFLLVRRSDGGVFPLQGRHSDGGVDSGRRHAAVFYTKMPREYARTPPTCVALRV